MNYTEFFIIFSFLTTALLAPTLSWTVSGVKVHKVHLDRAVEDSPWCFAVTSIVDLPPGTNFLATQVWPSARVAATALQQHLTPSCTVVCELGCGPGLPSLVAATKHSETTTIATDVDEFSLELVTCAAKEQKLDDNLQTSTFDLLTRDALPEADLYVLSDVFESSSVARGAAWHTVKALEAGARVWVFAQSDRAQREVYMDELRQECSKEISWSSFSHYPGDTEQLWLCEVDETAVPYG